MRDAQMRTWAEVDLDRLTHNYLALRACLEPKCKFLGVVKANAYGHGAVPVAQKLEELGADYLAVACLEEAAQLRAAGLEAPILIFDPTPIQWADDLMALNLTQMTGDMTTAQGYAEAAVRAGKTMKIHIAVDTGMSRLGFLCSQRQRETSVAEIAAICALPGLEAEGIFTHFADADGSEEYTMLQFTRFLDVLDALDAQGVTFEIRHCAASAAVLNYPCTHLDMVRPGIALYGHYPAPEMEELCPLLPVMTLKTRVAAVRALPAGTQVSYGRTYTLAQDGRLAVLPIGYGDGFFRLLSNRGRVLLHGVPCPIVGRICMDLCMVRVDEGQDVQPGDVVTLYGDDCSAEQAADLAGTIQYELLCAVSQRVPRVYLPKG